MIEALTQGQIDEAHRLYDGYVTRNALTHRQYLATIDDLVEQNAKLREALHTARICVAHCTSSAHIPFLARIDTLLKESPG
jgi:hypothetical protein